MKKRNWGDIKSILHFNFPYTNEPNRGLTDEAGAEHIIWKGYNNYLAGNPKFAWTCLNSSQSCYLQGTTNINDDYLYIMNSKNYELEAFMKMTQRGVSGTILKLDTSLSYFNGHSFVFYNLPLVWDQAKKFCEDLGGHLATSTSQEKQDFLHNLSGTIITWLGGTDENSEGNWKWITGEEWDYTYWASGQPDNSGGAENYVQLNFNSNGRWNDAGNNAKSAFICEWDYEIQLPDEHNHSDLILSLKEDGTLSLSGICEEITSSIAFTPNKWQHVLLRFHEGECSVWLDGNQILSTKFSTDILTHNITLNRDFTLSGKFFLDEFVFRTSAGSGTPKIPAAPYNAAFDAGLVGGFGTGSLGDVTISTDSYINSYRMLESPSKYGYFEGHTFKLYDLATTTWEAAKANCEALGGHLATSTSAEKNAFLTTLANGNAFHLGGCRIDDVWTWLTNEEFDYTNWYSASYPSTDETKTSMYANKNGKWYNMAPTSKHYYICEWDYIIESNNNKTFFIRSGSDEMYTPTVGSEVMLHITAPISTTSRNYPDVGLYAFSKIASIDGVNITLENEITTENGFDFTLDSSLLNTYYVQVITVPHFNTLTIRTDKTVKPRTWNTTTGGGIVAFRCKGDCTINGSIITHGKGAVRYDWIQMENSKLIDRFLCAQGGGIFITCGGTFTTSENARLGATWSGNGDGSNGAAGYGGNSGYNNLSSTNYSCNPKLGGIGGGGGGTSRQGTGKTAYTSGGNAESSGRSYAENGNSYSGGGGGGCGGAGGNVSVNGYYAGGSGGGGQGNSGGAGGSYNGASASTVYVVNGIAGTINGGDTVAAANNNRSYGGAGGGAPGGNGGNGYWYRGTSAYGGLTGGKAGACIIIICENLNTSVQSISTGGGSGQIFGESSSKYGCAGGGGTGFCYIWTTKLLKTSS